MDKQNKKVLDRLAAEKAQADEYSLDVNEIYSSLSKVAQQKTPMLDSSHQDKLVQNLTQKINPDADGAGMAELKKALKALDDNDLIEIYEMVEAECDARGLEEEAEEHAEEEEAEGEDMENMMSFVMASLQSLARKAADEGNIEAAYMIERTMQKIS